MTKKELNDKCKEIWSSYKLKEQISIEDRNWLIENIFRHHPEWKWWDDQGVIGISVGRASKFGSPCFYIHFENGKCADISWVKSISNIKNKYNKENEYEKN